MLPGRGVLLGQREEGAVRGMLCSQWALMEESWQVMCHVFLCLHKYFCSKALLLTLLYVCVHHTALHPYRRAQASMGLSELVEAEVDIKAGLLSHPDNTDLAALYRKLK
jgi:hypothetical protein